MSLTGQGKMLVVKDLFSFVTINYTVTAGVLDIIVGC